MDRDALVLRNQRMTNAFHRTPLKHHIRHGMLRFIAWLPLIPAPPRSIDRILLIRPDHLGDVLLTTPAIHALRQANPRATIHMLVGPWSARLVADYAEVDQVLTLPFPGFSREPKSGLRSPYRVAYDSARRLRQIGYSSAIIFRPDHWWGAMVAYLAGIPERIGYDMPDTRPFLTHSIEYRHEHAVMQSLHLVEHWTGVIDPQHVTYRYPLEAADESYIDGYLAGWGIDRQTRLVGIHPGSGTWVKQWDDAKWSKVADLLSAQMDATIVFTGTKNELQLVDHITSQMTRPYCTIAGETEIGQLAALFKRAYLVLGPDSGPLHLAAAVGTPTVTLYGPADTVEFGPWGDPHQHAALVSGIGCQPCRILDWADDNPDYHPCVRDITVVQVLEAAHRVVSE